MEMQVKRQLIYLLQNRVKEKFLSYDLQDTNVNEKAKAEEYVPQIEDLLQSVSHLAYNYGVYVNVGTNPLYDDDTNFMSDYNSLVGRLSSIPFGSSFEYQPINKYVNELQHDVGVSGVICIRKKGGLTGNFYAGGDPIFRQQVGGLTDERIPFLIVLVTNMILYPGKFRLRIPDGNIVNNMSVLDIARFFLDGGFNFVEKGNYYDITIREFDPPQVIRNSSAIYPTANDINNYNENSDFEIIE